MNRDAWAKKLEAAILEAEHISMGGTLIEVSGCPFCGSTYDADDKAEVRAWRHDQDCIVSQIRRIRVLR